MRALPFLLVSTLAAACGGSDLDPGSGNDPGTGTSTLFVNAEAEANPQLPNAQRGEDFNTSFDIEVRRNGGEVNEGTVTITSSGGSLALTSTGGGNWHGTQNGYHEVYILDVVSGADNVQSVRLDGPAIHHFTAPTSGITVNATVPLVVEWERAESAQTATFESKKLDHITIEDTGTYTIPIGSLDSSPTETKDDRVRLDRTSRLAPGGAVGGSEFTVTVHNAVEFLLAPTGP